MELIAALVVAGPLGYLVKARRYALGAYLLLWAVIFPIQTISVHNEGHLDPVYGVVNALILAGGICLNHLGAYGRRRREQTAPDRASA